MSVPTGTAAIKSSQRLKLAYVSPLPPERSGISDYSAELLPELSRHYDIDVVVEQDSISDQWIKANCPLRSVAWFRAHAGSYDRVLYHFGNSHFHQHMFALLEEVPGVVVLHDFFLANILADMDAKNYRPGAWGKALYQGHGYAALQQWFHAADPGSVLWKYPCSSEVLERALGVIVHSESSRKLARQWYGEDAPDNWAVLPLLRVPASGVDRSEARRRLGLGDDDFVVCSFGLLGPSKLNHRLLDAWLASALAKNRNCVLVFVGENHSGEYGAGLLSTIDRSGLGERIRITGWADAATYRSYLAAADAAVQLRTLSRGETSAAVLDCMNYALPTIVNAHGSMADLQDDAVWKLPDEFNDVELISALETLGRDHSRRQLLGAKAREIILTRHAPRACADQYAKVIESMYQAAHSNGSEKVEADPMPASPDAWAILQQLKIETGQRIAAEREHASALEAKVLEAEIKAQQAEAKAQQAEIKSQQTEARAQQAEIKSQQTEARAQQAEAKVLQTEIKSRQTEARALHAENRAHHAEIALNAMYGSTSWRITAPLRKLSLGTKSVATRGKGAIKSLLRPVLLAGLRVVRAVPPLKGMLLFAARRFPAAGGRFLALAEAHPRPLARMPRTTRSKPVAVPSQYRPAPARRSFIGAPEKPKRVLYYYVDHTIGCPVNTGMQRVTRGLARGLLEAGEELVFVRWSPETKSLVKIDRDQLQHLCRWQGPVMNPQTAAAYPEAGAPDEPIDAHEERDGSWLVVPEVTHINYHGAAPTLDVLMRAKEAKLKTAFVFYDAIPLRRAEFAGMAHLHAEYMQHLLLADLVVPISKWSARDIVSFFVHHENSAPAAIPVVEPLLLPGETNLTSGGAAQAVEAQKIILAVGTIERRKNQGVLLKAFEGFHARHPDAGWKLVLVGNLHANMMDEVNAAVSRNRNIVYKGNASDEILDELYRTCAFTVFPSQEEGFGLPIVESLDYGKPCICANFGAMAEVADGGGCLTVDVRDAGALEDAIARLAEGAGDELEELVRQAKARKSKTWAGYTGEFRALLDSVTAPKNKIGRIYYWVDQTCVYPANTGIQRVVRGLARAMIENGLDLVPVKWDMQKGDFASPSDDELAHLAKWNGPAANGWSAWDAGAFDPADWLIIPEVISAPSGPDISAIAGRAHFRGLRVASIFYDAIPWKMRDIYPPEATRAHGDYMCALNESELVFSISEHSNNDLSRFLRSQLTLHTPNLFERLRVAYLPGELLETPRNTEIKPAGDEVVRILSVGTVEPRKNHLALLQALKKAQGLLPENRRVELVIAGGAPFPALAEEVGKLVRSIPGVSWEQGVDDARLRELYHSSDFTVYPSLEEGFGLPILESLWNARPCVCRNASSMAEIAVGGGCTMVDTTDIDALAAEIVHLVVDDELRLKLSREAVSRSFKTWLDYAGEIVQALAEERFVPGRRTSVAPEEEGAFRESMVNLEERPLLSVCISTYNRAGWLALSLENLTRLMPVPVPGVEIVVCDNTSADRTPEVAEPYKVRPDFRYYRNPSNVGMLGNLRVTAHHARGRYVWILGDDDLVAPGAIEKVLDAIRQNPDAALVYLNYAYTREEDAGKITNLDRFFADATPIAAPSPDLVAPISRLSTLSENFFTAIYCLVFRRDHAMRAYTQDTSGRPFSTMLTCIPTTYHVLNNMMHEKGVWLGSPQLVVNMNVSWLKYASIWILERIPEAFDVAEKMGAPREEVDARRVAHLASTWHWFGEILRDDPDGNAAYFDPARLFSRFKHLPEFQARMAELVEAYEDGCIDHPGRFLRSPDDLIPSDLGEE